MRVCLCVHVGVLVMALAFSCCIFFVLGVFLFFGLVGFFVVILLVFVFVFVCYFGLFKRTEASALRNVAIPCPFIGKWHFLLFSEGYQYTLGLNYQEHPS